jgi:ribosome-binding factor A
MTGSRKHRVSDLIQQEVARLLQTEMHDTRLGFLTVTGVSMTNDLRHARVFVSTLASGEAREEALRALEAARGFLRRRLGQTLRLRFTPELTFAFDASIEQGARIERLLGDIQAPREEEDGGEES